MRSCQEYQSAKPERQCIEGNQYNDKAQVESEVTCATKQKKQMPGGNSIILGARIAIKQHGDFCIVVLLFGTVFYLNSALLHGIFPACFTSSLNFYFCPGLGWEHL